MHYKRLQKYGKKLAVAVLTSAVLLASGATVYAEDTGEDMAQETGSGGRKRRSCRSGNTGRRQNAGCFRRTAGIRSTDKGGKTAGIGKCSSS